MNCIRRLFMIAVFATAALPARAAFELMPDGARAAALSDAYTAVSDDIHSLFFNPGGLYQLSRPELTMQYGKLLTGLDDGTNLGQGLVAFGQPLPKGAGTLGIGYSSLSLSGLYSESVVSVGYGRGFMGGRLGLGAAVKWMRVGYGSDSYTGNALDNNANSTGAADPLLAAHSSQSAIGADLGVLYHAHPRLDIGFAILNANEPNIGLAETVKVPRSMRFGAATWAMGGRWSADVIRGQTLDSQTDTTLAVGYERRHSRAGEDIVLRGGGNVGTRDQRQLSGGLGWRRGFFQVDYGLTIPLSGLQAANLSHRLSLTFRFGVHAPALEPRESALEAVPYPAPAAAPVAVPMPVIPIPVPVPPAAQPPVAASPAVAASSAPAPIPPAVESPAAAPAAVAASSAPVPSAGDFAAEVARYHANVTGGTDRAERISVIQDIMQRYRDSGVDLGELKQELQYLQERQKK
jgi:hypothetical protein